MVPVGDIVMTELLCQKEGQKLMMKITNILKLKQQSCQMMNVEFDLLGKYYL